jgi:hypothetical protein
MAISQVAFSASTNGECILISDTATAGTEFHACGAGTSEKVVVYATNKHTAPVLLTLEMGAATSPIQHYVVNQGGEQLVCEGFFNVSSATSCAAFAGTTNVVSIHGYVLKET